MSKICKFKNYYMLLGPLRLLKQNYTNRIPYKIAETHFLQVWSSPRLRQQQVAPHIAEGNKSGLFIP